MSASKQDVVIVMNEDCQFMKDLADTSNEVNRGMYNLICSKRDLKLYTKGIKPHRRWKITDVKKYFGINGNPEIVLKKLNTIYGIINSEI